MFGMSILSSGELISAVSVTPSWTCLQCFGSVKENVILHDRIKYYILTTWYIHIMLLVNDFFL